MIRPIRRVLLSLPAWFFLGLMILACCRWLQLSDRDPRRLPLAGVDLSVQRVIDGDTLLLESGQRVRLIGVDTPETKHPDRPPEPWGPEATEFTRQFVKGHPIRLVYDRERFDDYFRVLAFVFVEDRCLNEELIRAGLSPAKLRFPLRSDFRTRFRKAEEEARKAKRGLWQSINPSHPSWRPMAAGRM